jgi:hypothetical protein
MSHLIKYTDFLKDTSTIMQGKAYVMTDRKSHPVGFAFGREAFIQMLEKMDEYYQDAIPDQEKAYANPAGKLIDQIEDHIPLKENYVEELRDAVKSKDPKSWIPFDEMMGKM